MPLLPVPSQPEPPLSDWQRSDQFERSDEFRAAGFWIEDTLTTVIDRWADEGPDRNYLSDGTSSLTYGQARDQAWTLAAGFAALGIGRGDRVAVQLPNWNEFVLVYAALARLGAIMVPFVTVYRRAEAEFIVENSGAVALIVPDQFGGFDHAGMAADIAAALGRPLTRVVVRGEARDGALALSDLLAGTPGRPALPEPPSADDLHVIMYSSGTEARSKGCLHTWNTSSFLARQAIPAMGMTRDDTVFMPLPVTHALGLTLAVMAGTLAGGAIHLMDVFDPATALDRIVEHRCTGTASPAPYIRLLLDAFDPQRHDLSLLRFWLTAGASIPASLVQEAAERIPGCRVVTAYGSSEVTIATVSRGGDPVDRVADTDGYPVPGVALRIVTEDGTAAPTGVDGEIRYRGPGRCLGYWARPDLTAACLDDAGWWRTGDVGRLDEHGYLRVTGRIKDIIIRGGFNVSAREVEDALLLRPDVNAVAVVGLPDPAVGERVCAVLVPTPGHAPPTLAGLRDHLVNEHGMAVWKVPERLEIAAEWPVTPTGKVKKYLLRQSIEAAADLYTVRWSAVEGPAPAVAGSWAVVGDGAVAALVRRVLDDGGARVVEPEAAATVVHCPPDPGDVVGEVHRAAADGLAALTGLVARPGADVVWVTADAVAAGPDDPGTGVAHAVLWGLARGARAEHPGLPLRLLDIGGTGGSGDTGDTAGAPDPAAVLAALAHTDEPELAVRGAEVRAPRLAAADAAIGRTLDVRGGTVLVVGGPGTLGRALGRRLVERGATRVLLVSRRGPDDPRAAAAVAELTAAGAQARAVACDVTDGTALGHLLDGLDAADPEAPLRAVVHCAGVPGDGPLTGCTAERLADVLRAGVDGALVLDRVTRGRPVELFALVSSVAGVLGGAGRGARGAADAFRGLLAARRRAEGLPGTSVAFGDWAGGDGDGPERAAVPGLPALEPGHAADLFELAVLGADAQPVALAVDPGRLPRSPADGASPLWRTLFPPAATPAAAPGTAAPAAEESQLGAVLAIVTAEAADALDLPASGIGPDRRFGELGLSSLSALDLRNRLGARLGIRLPATLLFDQPTPRDLARYLIGIVPGLGAVATPAPRPQTEPPAAPTRTDEPIAVVAMSCRLPGGADDPDRLWRLLSGGGDAIGPFPAHRWDVDALYDPDPDRAGTSSAREGGFLDRIDTFDATLFGIPPREALLMDPQQRILLETAWEALERGNIVPASLAGSATGVYVGMMATDYLSGVALEQIDGYYSTGRALSVASGRLAYTFGLVGPAVTVDTACSSSLTAVHMAASGLRSGDCDLALACGVTVMTTPRTFVEFSRLRGLSPSGRCRSFSDDADGTGFAEGAAVVVLKRLSDAQRDGDPVLAVLRGTATNQDGHSQGLSVPFGPSQEQVVRSALVRSGLGPADIDYVEAHGTGTTLGDPIEANALSRVFGPGRDPGRPLLLGSLKSNVGHTQAAAGVAGLLKVVLALRHGELPATLHADEPTRHVDWESSGLRLVRGSTPWPRGERPRRAGVSAFGVSGTNVHVIVEEAPVRTPARVDRPAPGTARLFPVSARDDAALHRQADRLAAHVRVAGTDDLDGIAATLALGRARHARRGVVVARDRDELADRLTALAQGRDVPGVAHPPADGPVSGRLAFLLPGHSAQWTGMGAALLAESSAFASAVQRCEQAFAGHLDWSVSDVLRGAPGAPDPRRVDVTHPVLFTLTRALGALWRSLGVVPDAVVGHSLGEVAAAQLAGALTLDRAATIAAVRGRVLRPLDGHGGAVSVPLPVADVRRRLAAFGDRLTIAAVNSADSTTVSGDPASLTALESHLDAADVPVRRVPVPFAVHSPQVEPMADELRRELAAITGTEQAIPLYSTVLAAPVRGADLDAGYWARNLREPVRFADTVRRMLDDGFRHFVELSAHPGLGALVHAVAQEAGVAVTVTGTLRRDDGGLDGVLSRLAGLVAAGHDPAVEQRTRDTLPTLPTYPFEPRRFWTEPARASAPATGGPFTGTHVEDADRPDRHVVQCRIDLSDRRHAALADHRIDGEVLLPGAAHLSLLLDAADRYLPGNGHGLAGVVFERPLALTPDEPVTLQAVLSPPDDDGGRAVTVASRRVGARAWTRHVSGRLTPADVSGVDSGAGSGLPGPERACAECADPVDVPGVYAALDAGGIGYGPAFRLLEWARRGADRAVGRLAVGPVAFGGAIDAAVLDAAFHVAVLPVNAPSGRSFVPAGVAGVRREGASARPVWVTARVREASRTGAVLDLRLFDEHERPVLAVDGLEITEPGRRETPVHDVRWRERPPAAGPEVRGTRLVVADGPESAHLAARLTERLDGCVVAGDRADDRADDMDRLLTDVAPAQVVVLSALDAPPGTADPGPLGCTTLLRVVQAITARARDTRLVVVTRGAQAAGGSAAVTHPEQAAAWGFGTAVAAEHPELRTTLLDLPGDGSGENALVAELRHGDEARVALRDGHRWVPRLARTRVEDSPAALRPDRTYLVTGGHGGLGRVAAGRLVAAGARHVALLGRGAPSAAPAWAPDGCTVHAVRADVADRDGLAAALDGLRAAAPPIGGVVHAAGVLDDATVATATAEQLARVLAPKIAGTVALTELVPDDAWLVLFSSAAGVLGSPGQAAYCAANAFLDAWAHHTARSGRRVLSLDWGAWSGVGMAASTMDRVAHVTRTGIGAFTPDEGGALLDRLLGSDRRQLVPIRFEPGHDPAAAGPLLADLAAARATAGPVAPGERIRAASGTERHELVARYLTGVVAAVTGTAAADIGPATPLAELALDSLMRVTLTSTVSRELGITVPSRVAQTAVDVRGLAAEVLAALPAAGTAATAPSTGARPEPAASGPGTRRPLTRDGRRLLRAEQQGTPVATHTIGFALRLTVRATREHLTAVLERLASRHAALRTAVVDDERDGVALETAPRPAGGLLTWSAVPADTDAGERLRALLEPPFDLARAPLWRFELLEYPSGAQALVYGAHHVVSDAASLLLIMGEIGAELGGTVLDGDVSDRDADALVAAQTRDGGPREDPAWRDRFRGVRRLDLAPDSKRPVRPARRGYRAGSVTAELPPDLVDRVGARAAALGVTPAAVCLGTLTVALARLRREHRFVVAVPVDTRVHADALGALGYFGVPIPFPAEVGDHDSVTDVLRRTDERLDRVLERGVSFVDAMTALVGEGLHRDGAPLVEVYFNFLRSPGPVPGTVELLRAGPGWTDLDLMVTVAPDLGQVWLDFNRDILDEAVTGRFARAYLDLLAEAADGAQGPALPAPPTTTGRTEPVALAATFALGDLPAMLGAALTPDAGAPVVDTQVVDTPVVEAPYHQVLAALHDPAGVFDGGAAAGVVLLRGRDLERFGPLDDAMSAELAREYPAALRAAAARTAGPLVVGFLPDPQPDERLRRWEEQVAAALEDVPGLGVLGAGVLGADDWAREHAVAEPFDAEADAAAHLPFRAEFRAVVALTLADVLRAARRPAPKVIAVDGDETLWGGVAGELGSAGVDLSGPRAGLARRLLAWRAAGVLLVLVTNNDEALVQDVLARPDGLLDAEHFAVVSAGWGPKPDRIARAAATLGAATDTVLYLDDNPAEIAAVRSALPEVLAVTCPPADRLDAFLRRLWPVAPRATTGEDAARAGFHRDERRRAAERARSGFAEFLRCLELEVDARPLTPDTTTRSVQLGRRVTQFALGTGAPDAAALAHARDRGEVWTVTVRDRFGDYGQVGLLVLEPGPDALDVVTWLLSCRALGRGVEGRLLGLLADRADANGCPAVRLTAERTARNEPARRLLSALGGGPVDAPRLETLVTPRRLRAHAAGDPVTLRDGTADDGTGTGGHD